MKERLLKWLLITLILSLSIIIIIKFGGPKFLQNYVKSGIGDCESIPILCKMPEGEIIDPRINDNYLQEYIPYKFPKIEIYAPKGFKVVQELIKKPYYIKRKPRNGEPVIYLLHQAPGYFPAIFPQLKNIGIANNYDFLRNVMFARISQINNINDAFFVVMKGIFIPDLGDQNNAVMTKFKLGKMSGFINYNLGKKINYFDCTMVSNEGDFFKIYIKDTQATLDLEKVFTIISTISNGKQKA